MNADLPRGRVLRWVEQFPAVLIFYSGIGVSMFTEIAASRSECWIRLAAAMLFLASGLVLFFAGISLESTIRRGKELEEPPAQLLRRQRRSRSQVILATVLQIVGWLTIIGESMWHIHRAV